MIPTTPTINSSFGWVVPHFELTEFAPRKTRYAVCIPVINEGEKIIGQLEKMQRLGVSNQIDILLLDGGSTDGSTEQNRLSAFGVRALLVKIGSGKLSAQLRMGFAYSLSQGYEGIITVDGNGKDGIEAIPDFIRELEAGADFVQGSRYIPGGQAIHTPWVRSLAIHLLHAPIISLAAGFKYTDTTNGFRAFSRNYLLDPRVQPFREVFGSYELLAYLSVRAPQISLKTREIPVTRQYPAKGKTPTKISHFRGNFLLLTILLKTLLGKFNPTQTHYAS